MASIPRLANVNAGEWSESPRISILFGARDEAEKIARALSNHGWHSIIRISKSSRWTIARKTRRERFWMISRGAIRHLKVVHVYGAARGLAWQAARAANGLPRSTGEWLVFTDADVRFAPDLLAPHDGSRAS